MTHCGLLFAHCIADLTIADAPIKWSPPCICGASPWPMCLRCCDSCPRCLPLAAGGSVCITNFESDTAAVPHDDKQPTEIAAVEHYPSVAPNTCTFVSSCDYCYRVCLGGKLCCDGAFPSNVGVSTHQESSLPSLPSTQSAMTEQPVPGDADSGTLTNQPNGCMAVPNCDVCDYDCLKVSGGYQCCNYNADQVFKIPSAQFQCSVGSMCPCYANCCELFGVKICGSDPCWLPSRPSSGCSCGPCPAGRVCPSSGGCTSASSPFAGHIEAHKKHRSKASAIVDPSHVASTNKRLKSRGAGQIMFIPRCMSLGLLKLHVLTLICLVIISAVATPLLAMVLPMLTQQHPVPCPSKRIRRSCISTKYPRACTTAPWRQSSAITPRTTSAV